MPTGAGNIIAAMKRLALSIVGGVVIPFLYTIIVGPLTTYSDNSALNLYAGYPVRWPILILYRFFPVDFLNEMILSLSFIGGNVLLYTFVTYIVLSAFWKPKATSRVPPPPVQPSLNS
jgi:hypothetical protein